MLSGGFRRNGNNGSGKVVSLNRFRNGTHLSPLRQAEAYWTALRSEQAAAGGVPLRSQIDPRGLENLLGRAFVLQSVAPGVARFRLSGHHVNAVFGTELRGMPVSALFEGDSRSRVGAALEHMLDSPAIAEFAMHCSSCLGLARLDARMLLLPLRDDTGSVNRALGIIVTDGVPAGGRPRRFELDDVDLRPVLGRGDADRPDLADSVVPQGFAETATPLLGAPHLKLVVSRD